jgi:hypothetical protein
VSEPHVSEPTPTSDPAWLPDPREPFWKPSFGESFRYAGWRLIASGLLLLVVMAVPIVLCVFGQVWILSFWKFIAVGVATPIVLAASAVRTAMQTRRAPFCIHCGYSLEGLPDHHSCPECGRPYSHHLIADYQRDPAWFVHRCKLRQSLPATHAPFEAGPSRRRSRDGT